MAEEGDRKSMISTFTQTDLSELESSIENPESPDQLKYTNKKFKNGLIYEGSYHSGQKFGRGKLLDEKNNQFIEGEWVNDRLVKLHNAQFQISNTEYVRLYALDNLYTNNKNNFVARILLPSLNIFNEHFENMRKEIESNIVITKILDDDLKNNLEISREKFQSALNEIQKSVTISKVAQCDMFHLFLLMENFKLGDENIIVLNKIINNYSISEELRNEARIVCQDEKNFLERNKGLLLMSQVEMNFSWTKVISDRVNASITKLKIAFNNALPTRTFVSSGPEDIKKIPDLQLLACSVHDIQLFSDLELTTQQYLKTELDIHNLSDFVQNYISKLWSSLITKICKSDFVNDISANKGKYTNPVFLQLFKTFLELLKSVCDERKEEVSKIVNVKANADLCIINSEKHTPKLNEMQLKFIISLINHFKPGDVKNNHFQYNFSFFKVTQSVFKRLTDRIVDYFDNSLASISQEYVIWLYYVHKSFSDAFYREESTQNDTNKQNLFVFINSMMNLLIIVMKNQTVTLEIIRILAESIIKFGTTISPYFLEETFVNEDEMSILLKQAEYMKDFVTSNEHNVNDIANIVDIYQVFWDERKNVCTELRTNYSSWTSAVNEIIEKFNFFTQYVFNLKIYNSKFLMFLRSFNEFMRLLQATKFLWYVKEENVISKNIVKLIDKDARSYLVQDNGKFVNDFFVQFANPPRHFLFDLTKKLLSYVEEFMQQTSWAASDKLQAAGELLLLMGRSLIDFNRMPSAVDFEHFFAIFTEPFQRVTQHASDVQDFKRRLASLENYYKYTMELNVMSVTKALELCKQNISSNSNSLIDYTINFEKLNLSYNMYEKKFKNYVEKYILQPDFDIDNFAKKIRKKAKLLDISKWDLSYKILEIPKLVAGLSAVWSALESEDVVYQKQVIKPQFIQILCVLRLLGADQAESGATSHLAQVLTGQGKSLVLALLATALALTGNPVRIVCYNKQLAERDRDNFNNFYKTFNIDNDIKYGTFKDMANEILQPSIKGQYFDLRLFVNKLVINELPNLCAQDKTKSVLKTVLLIDEVDVFFSAEFYGSTYNPCTMTGCETLASLQLKIWSLTADCSNICEIQIIINKFIEEAFFESTDDIFIKILRNSKNILITHVSNMISDALNVRNNSYDERYARLYKLREDGRIIRIYKGEHTTSSFSRYNNVFMYFKLKKTNFDHQNFQNYGYLNIKCGQISYAMLPKDYHLILGVTGTLKQLSEVETRAVASYNITRGSDMPTFFGSNKLRITNFNIEETEEQWTTAILNNILSVVNEGRAVIVFFEDEDKIKRVSSHFSNHLSRYSVLTGNEDSEEVANCVEEAGVARKVTIATRHMGRGVDFQSNDSAVESKGGVHVIQTFFSDDVKEETQIKGRTARKDNNGSYEMILCRKHLNQAKYVLTACNYDELNTERTRRAQDRETTLARNIEESQKVHDATMEFLKSFYNYSTDKRDEYFKKFPFVEL